jgi:hypothetical protein
MPTPVEILEGLAEISQRWRMLAIIWHVYYGVLVAALLFGVRPVKPVMGVLLALPLYSVSVLAWLAANPFNGTLFAALGVTLTALSFALPREPVELAPAWAVLTGAAMVAFGWMYPHFLATDSIREYLYAAPTGLIPCPTLSMTIGLALIVGGLDARVWPLVLAAGGLFYGVFGALRLGVMIDLVLAVGAAAVVVAVLVPRAPAQTERLRSAPRHVPGATSPGSPEKP